MNLARALASDVLLRVQKPSRYLGTEVNSVVKAGARVRLALCFPDLYDLGLGNLGLHVLYAILNRQDGVWAERVYAPAQDMEAELRTRGLRLFALESKDTLDEFDGIGFTLQSELTFTNILNVIDLAGLPLRTADRREGDPLTFAGGPAVFNPEPLAPFMDFFVIGDGEEVVVEIAGVLHRVHGRQARLEALAAIEGVYVPALYPMETLPDGAVVPPLGARPIRKRTVPVLRGQDFPVNYLVPFTEQVHDRVSLEVLRGCTQGCRFCQAGMTTRPVRERTVEDVEALMRRSLDATGYEEVGLVSLSTCDHSRVRQLVDRAVQVAREDHVSVGLPSLRLDSFSVELADAVADARRTGLTFAPEAATPRLRALINKWIPDEDLLRMSAEAYVRGWDHVKLYFMIGLPTERDEDIEAIADLCARTVDEGRKHNRNASVRTGVSTFVPKPFTPFQWAAQIGLDETEHKQRVLLHRLKQHKAIKFGRHHPEETFLEGLVSRADRRAADLIEAAWRHGARFDAWSEYLDFRAWQRAIEDTRYDVAYALRARDPEERLPWDHIDIHVPKAWFQADWARALQLGHAPDCRARRCHRCGVIDVERELCAHMLRNSIDGRKEEAAFRRVPLGARAEPPAVQRIRVRVGRTAEARFLSHLEWSAAWIRTLRRAKAPLSWSQGFAPHPRVNYAAALAVGEESVAEYMDVVLHRREEPGSFAARLEKVAPRGFLVFEAEEVPLNAPGMMGEVVGTDYLLHPEREVAREVGEMVAAERLPLRRKTKAGLVELDIRPMITRMRVRDDGAVELSLRDHAGKAGKAREVVALLGLGPGSRLVRTAVVTR
jgi:radical SAM family uncharacterized protein/radical SAM-linked protein